jgi:putative flippase GtrA
VRLPESLQGIDKADDAAGSLQENIQKRRADLHEVPANSHLDNNMRPDALKNANPISSNALGYSELRRIECLKSGGESDEKRDCLIAPSTLLRWCKFNLVGGIGIVMQLAALFFLRSVMHFNYLFATAIAVEAAVVHNFVWHERFTWADRVSVMPQQTARADAQTLLRRLLAALKCCAAQKLRGPRVSQFARFHLGNGAVSILGNLALMKVMVGLGHMNYLFANGVAITLCSLANFLVSERWVFAEKAERLG